MTRGAGNKAPVPVALPPPPLDQAKSIPRYSTARIWYLNVFKECEGDTAGEVLVRHAQVNHALLDNVVKHVPAI